jgi:hypothetical protein
MQTMNRVVMRMTPGLCAIVCTIGIVGCEQKQKAPRIVQPAGPRLSANPTPEEKFNFIVDTFRRGVENANIFFRVPREGGHSMLAGQNEVKHEFIKPTKEGDPYRGVITVVSQSHYSIQHSADRPEESARDEDARNQNSDSPLGDLNPSDGIDILDSDLAARAGTAGPGSRPSALASESTISRRENQSDRKYELEYKDGRWTLLTELDPKTEQAIEYAFDYALKTQI